MRSVIVVLLIALASTVSAGSIRPAAVLTTADEDTGIKYFMRYLNATTCATAGRAKGCTDAEVKLVNPTLTIYPTTAAGYQDYSTTIYASMVRDHARQGTALKASKQLPAAYLTLSPAVQAQIDTLAGIQ